MAFFAHWEGDLLELSDFDIEVNPSWGTAFQIEEVPLTVEEIEAKYYWDSEAQNFLRRDPVVLTRLEFLRRLTMQERIAIRSARATDPVIEDFMDLLDKSAEIRLDDPDTMMGVGYLQQVGLLTAERAAAILAE